MYSFDSIAGYKAEKEELKKLCNIFNNRQSYVGKGARLPKGLILYGEPGNGKTLFAKVLAAECNMPLSIVDLTDVSETQSVCRKIKKAFDAARKNKCLTMIFMDEIDKVLPNCNEDYVTDQSKMVLTQLLTLIDGISNIGDIFFVATCNDYDDIPASLVRPGRVDRKINIDFPNLASRVEILNMYMQKSNCEFEQSAEEIATFCAGLSGAALEMLVNECILMSDSENRISAELVADTIDKINQEDISRNLKLSERMLNAAHQVGHYVVGQFFHQCDSVILRDDEKVCNAFYDAFLAAEDDDEDDDDDDAPEEDDVQGSIYFVKSDFCDLFAVLFGGKVGEELFFKGETDNCRRDMRRIRYLFVDMAECGMWGTDVLYCRYSDDLPYPQYIFEQLNERYFQMIAEAERNAVAILKANKALCEMLISELVNTKFLNSMQLKQIVKKAGGIKRDIQP